MLKDLDNSIVELLQSTLPRALATSLSITFATPSVSFPPSTLTLPAVNFFLYSTLPNTGLRENAPSLQWSTSGVAARVRPPVYLDSAYLVSVWADPTTPDSSKQEHDVFATVMKALLAAPGLPAACLQGALQRTQAGPVQSKVTGEAGLLGNLWQSLGIPARLAFNYTVTFAMPLFDPEPVELVTGKEIRIGLIESGLPG